MLVRVADYGRQRLRVMHREYRRRLRHRRRRAGDRRAGAARDRALARARASRRETGADLPERRARTVALPPPVAGPPVDDRVATLATAYLVDGYAPDDVAARLGVDRGWCRAIAARLRGRR